MSAGHYLLLVLIYLFIHVLLYYHCSNLFRTVYKLSCLIFRRIFSLEFYNYEIQNFVYWRQNFHICRNLFLAVVFLFLLFFSFTLCNKLLLGSCKFSGSILRQFDWCFVLLLFTLQITKSNIKYLLQIIFSKG